VDDDSVDDDTEDVGDDSGSDVEAEEVDGARFAKMGGATTTVELGSEVVVAIVVLATARVVLESSAKACVMNAAKKDLKGFNDVVMEALVLSAGASSVGCAGAGSGVDVATTGAGAGVDVGVGTDAGVELGAEA
jgi:hypothetical protein